MPRLHDKPKRSRSEVVIENALKVLGDNLLLM